MPTSRVSSIINRINRVLKTTNAFDRTVYLRTTTSTGGDPLTGRYGTLSVTDTLLVPQPFVERLGRERIPGGHTNAQTYKVGSNMKVGDDYSIIVSSSMVSLTQLQNPQCQFVFKDGSGNVELLTVHDFETVSLDGSDVAYNVYCRSGQIT